MFHHCQDESRDISKYILQLQIVDEREKTQYPYVFERVGATNNGYSVIILKKLVHKLRVQLSNFYMLQNPGGVVGYHAGLTHHMSGV